MPFGEISTLHFPIAANAGSSQWGSDVRRVNASADASADTGTVCNLGTGGTVTRTCDPYTTNASDLAQADYGWAVQPSDMNSVAGARRFYPAGDWVFTLWTAPSTAFTTETKNLLVYIFRVGPAPGRARTQIGSGSAAMGITAGAVTITVAMPEVIFEPDETVQFSFEMNAGGLAVLGRTVQFATGLSASPATQVRVDTPTLQTLASTVGAAAGSGAGTAELAATGAMAGSSAGSGSGSAALAATAETSGTAAGSGSGAGALAGIGTSAGSALGAAVASAALAAVGVMAGAAAGAGGAAGALSIVLGTAGAAAGLGAASALLGGVGAMAGSSAGSSSAAGSFGAVSETAGSAAGLGAAAAGFAAVVGTVGEVDIGQGGSTVVVRRRVIIFDKA